MDYESIVKEELMKLNAKKEAERLFKEKEAAEVAAAAAEEERLRKEDEAEKKEKYKKYVVDKLESKRDSVTKVVIDGFLRSYFSYDSDIKLGSMDFKVKFKKMTEINVLTPKCRPINVCLNYNSSPYGLEINVWNLKEWGDEDWMFEFQKDMAENVFKPFVREIINVVKPKIMGFLHDCAKVKLYTSFCENHTHDFIVDDAINIMPYGYYKNTVEYLKNAKLGIKGNELNKDEFQKAKDKDKPDVDLYIKNREIEACLLNNNYKNPFYKEGLRILCDKMYIKLKESFSPEKRKFKIKYFNESLKGGHWFSKNKYVFKEVRPLRICKSKSAKFALIHTINGHLNKTIVDFNVDGLFGFDLELPGGKMICIWSNWYNKSVVLSLFSIIFERFFNENVDCVKNVMRMVVDKKYEMPHKIKFNNEDVRFNESIFFNSRTNKYQPYNLENSLCDEVAFGKEFLKDEDEESS